MNIRSGPTEVTVSSPARRIPANSGETASLIKRLQRIIAMHVEASARIKCPQGLLDILAVIAALEAEVDGFDPANHLDSGEAVSTSLRAGLYEELLGEPSNVFVTTRVSEEVVRYEAMPGAFWKECLALLKDRLTRAQKPRPFSQ